MEKKKNNLFSLYNRYKGFVDDAQASSTQPSQAEKERRAIANENSAYERWKNNLTSWQKVKAAAIGSATRSPLLLAGGIPGAIAFGIGAANNAFNAYKAVREGDIEQVSPLRAYYDSRNELGSFLGDQADTRIKEIEGALGLIGSRMEQANAHKKIIQAQRDINRLLQEQQQFMNSVDPDYIAKNRDSKEVQTLLSAYDQYQDQIEDLEQIINNPEYQQLDREYKKNLIDDNESISKKVNRFLSNAQNPFTTDWTEELSVQGQKDISRRKKIHSEYLAATHQKEREEEERYNEALRQNYLKQQNTFASATDKFLNENAAGKFFSTTSPLGFAANQLSEYVKKGREEQAGIANKNLQGSDEDIQMAENTYKNLQVEKDDLQEEYKNRMDWAHKVKKWVPVDEAYEQAKAVYQTGSMWNPYWAFHTMPGMMGSSSSSPHQFAGQVLQVGSAVALDIPNPYAKLAGAGGMMASQYLQFLGAEAENKAEVGERYLDNIASILNDPLISGEDHSKALADDLYRQAKDYYKNKGWTDEEIKKQFDPNTEFGYKNLLGALVGGIVKTSDPAVINAAMLGTKGLQAQYDADMMRTAGEIPVQTAAMYAMTPEKIFGRMFRIGEKMFAKPIIRTTERRLVNNVLSDGAEVTVASEGKSVAGGVGSKLTSTGGKYKNGINKPVKTYEQAFTEGYEFGAQVGDGLGYGVAGRTVGGITGGLSNVTGKFVKSQLPGTWQAALDQFATATMYKYQGVIDKLFSSGGRALAAKYGLKTLTKTAHGAAIDALSEGSEEGVQYLNSLKDFASQYGYGGMSLSDMIVTDFLQGARVSKAYLSLLGLTNSELKNDAEFWANVKGGFALGALYTGTISAASNIKGAYRQYGTDQIIVNSSAMDREADKYGRANGAVFARLAMNGRGQEALQYIKDQKLADSRREDPVYTQEMYDDKIKEVEGIISLASSNRVRSMLEAHGFEYGTDKYAVAISDLYNLQSQQEENQEETSLNNSARNAIYQSKEYQDALEKIATALPVHNVDFFVAKTKKRSEMINEQIELFKKEAKEAGKDIESEEFKQELDEYRKAAEEDVDFQLESRIKDNIHRKTQLVNKLSALLRIKAQINKIDDWYKATSKIGLKTKRPDAKYIKRSIDDQIKGIKDSLGKLDKSVNALKTDSQLWEYSQNADGVILYGADQIQQHDANLAMLAADASVTDGYMKMFTEGLVEDSNGKFVYNKSEQKSRDEKRKAAMQLVLSGKEKEAGMLVANIKTGNIESEDLSEDVYRKRIDAIIQADAENKKLKWLVSDMLDEDAPIKVRDAWEEARQKEIEKLEKAAEKAEVNNEIPEQLNAPESVPQPTTTEQTKTKPSETKEQVAARRRRYEARKRHIRHQAKTLKQKMRENRRGRLNAGLPFLEAWLTNSAINMLSLAKIGYYGFANFVQDVKYSLQVAKYEVPDSEQEGLFNLLKRTYLAYRNAQLLSDPSVVDNMDSVDTVLNYTEEQADNNADKDFDASAGDIESIVIDEELSDEEKQKQVDKENEKILQLTREINSLKNEYNTTLQLLQDKGDREELVLTPENQYFYSDYEDLTNSREYNDDTLESLYEVADNLRQEIKTMNLLVEKQNNVATEEDFIQDWLRQQEISTQDEDAIKVLQNLNDACANLDNLFTLLKKETEGTDVYNNLVSDFKRVFVNAQLWLSEAMSYENLGDFAEEKSLMVSIVEQIASNDKFADIRLPITTWWAVDKLQNAGVTLSKLYEWINYLQPRLIAPENETVARWYEVLIRDYIYPFLSIAQDQFNEFKSSLPETPSISDQEIVKSFPVVYEQIMRIVDTYMSTMGVLPDNGESWTGDVVQDINKMPVLWRDLYNKVVGTGKSRFTDAHSPSVTEMSDRSTAAGNAYREMSKAEDFLQDIEIFENVPYSEIPHLRKHKTSFNFYLDDNGEPKLVIHYTNADGKAIYSALSFNHNVVPQGTSQEVAFRIQYMNAANRRFKSKLKAMLKFIAANPNKGWHILADFGVNTGSLEYAKQDVPGSNNLASFLFAEEQNKHNLYTIGLFKEDRIGIYKPIYQSDGTPLFSVVTGSDLQQPMLEFKTTDYIKSSPEFSDGSIVYFYKTNVGKYIPTALSTKPIDENEAFRLATLIKYYASGMYTTVYSGHGNSVFNILDLIKQRIYADDYETSKIDNVDTKHSVPNVLIQKGGRLVVIDGTSYNTETQFNTIVEVLKSGMRQTISAKEMNQTFGTSDNPVWATVRDIFVKNKSLNTITLPNGFVISRSDISSPENNAPEGTTFMGYLMRNGYITSRAYDESYRQLNISNLRLEQTENVDVQHTDDVLPPNAAEIYDGDGQTKSFVDQSQFTAAPSSVTQSTNEPYEEFNGLMMLDENKDLLDTDRTEQEQNEFEKTAREYFEKVIGKSGVVLDMSAVEGYLSLAGAPDGVLGYVVGNLVTISKFAPTDTIYHEALHVIVELLMSDAERAKIYSMYRKAYGESLSERQVAEGLADLFVDWVNKIKTDVALGSSAVKLFKHVLFGIGLVSKFGIANAFKMIKFFRHANAGRYKDRKISEQRLKEFEHKFGALFYQVNGVDFPYIIDAADLKKFVAAAAYNIVRSEPFDPIDPHPERVKIDSNTIENMEKHHPQIVKDLRKTGLSEREILEMYGEDALKAAMMWRQFFSWRPGKLGKKDIRVYSMFDALRDKIASQLNSLFGDSREIDENPEDTKEDTAMDANDSWDRASYEFSRLDGVTKKVKMFFGTIPRLLWMDSVDKTTGKVEKKAVYDKSINIYGYQYVPLREAWGIVTRDLHDVKSIQDFMHEISVRANTDTIYHVINKRMNALYERAYGVPYNSSTIPSEPKNLDAESYLIQIVSSVSGQDIDFIVARSYKQPNGKRVVITSSSLDRDSRSFSTQWSRFLSEGQIPIFSNVRDQNDNIVLLPNTRFDIFKNIAASIEAIRAGIYENKDIVIDGVTYNVTTQEGFGKIKDKFISMLNQIGITFTREALDYMLSEDPNLGNTIGGFGIFLSPVGVTSITPFISNLQNVISGNGIVNQYLAKDLYSNLGFVKNLAQWQGAYNRITIDKQALGLNGKRLYSISQNSSLSYMVDQLNSNDVNNDLVRLLSAYEYVYDKEQGIGSIIIKAVRGREKSNIQAHTYIGFKTDNYGDGGSEYKESAEIEDYMAKFAMLQQGYLVMPTLADKSTYVVLSGVKIPGMSFVLNKDKQLEVHNIPDIMWVGQKGNQRPIIRPNNAVLDQMIQYAKLERAAIQRCMEDLGYKNIPGYTLTGRSVLSDSQKIKNLHTFVKVKGSKSGKQIEPNGTRFNQFSNIVILDSNGNPKAISLNDPNESSVDLLKKANDLFFDQDLDKQRDIMAYTLAQQHAAGIEKAISLGLVHRVNRSVGAVKFNFTQKNNVNLASDHLDRAQIEVLASAIYKKILSASPNWQAAENDKARQESRLLISQRKDICQGLAIAAIIADVENRAIISSQEALRCFIGNPAMFKIDYVENSDGKVQIKSSTADLQKRIGGLISTGDDNVIGIPGMPTEYTCAEVVDYEITSPFYEDGSIFNMFEEGEYREAYGLLTNDWQAAYQKPLAEVIETVESVPESSPQHKLTENVQKHVQQFTDSYAKEINVADGAAYITADMCKNLLRMRGAYNEKVKKAFDILTGDNTKYSWKDSVDAYKTIYDAVNIVTTKYTAYGFRSHNADKNNLTSIAVPYYNKFALFPIFPCIATGKMATLYDEMLKQGVDMMMMTSAVKLGSQGAVEFKDGKLNAPFVKYTQSYGFLRRQLNTDPEEDSESNLGTQMTKVGLQNLRLKRDNYVNPITNEEISGEEILDNYMRAVKRLAEIGEQEIVDMFFTNGEVDHKKLHDYLTKELTSRNANDQILKAVSLDKNGRLKAPLSATADANWIESILISTVNKHVIDIQTPGNSFVQRSVFAMEGSPVEGGSIQFDQNLDPRINGGNRLNLFNPDGSMDAVISIDYFDSIIPEDIKSFEKRRQWLIYHKIIGQDDKALTIGYRIPTQAESSIHALRFVDVVPAVKSTIILPEEFTKTTGSDYDIDHIYLASYNLNITSDGYSLTEFDDEKKTHQNTILNMLMTLLLDAKNTGHILYKSIDNDTALVKTPAEEIPDLGKLQQTAFNFGTLREQVERKKDFMIGKTGIGPFALNVTNNVLCRLYGMEFEESSFTKSTPIGSLHELVDKDYNSIDSWFSAFINAHVDIVKDPYISKLNVNPYTYNMVSLLTRSGFGDTTVWFCSQPIIRELANANEMANSQFSRNANDSLFKLRQQALKDAALKYITPEQLDAWGEISKDTENPRPRIEAVNWIYNHADVLKYFATHPNAEEYEGISINTVQERVYYAWKSLEPYSMALNKLVQYTKIDTRKHGKTLIEISAYEYNYKQLLNPKETKIFNHTRLHRMVTRSWISTKTKLAISLPRIIFGKQLFNANETFVNGCIGLARLFTPKQDGREITPSSDFISTISKQVQTAIKSRWIVQYAKNMSKYHSGMKDHTDDSLSGLFLGNWTIQTRLNRLKYAIANDPKYNRLSENYLIKHLSVAENKESYVMDERFNQRPQFIKISDVVTDSTTNGDMLSEGWLDLLNDPDTYVQQFARDLAVYAFLTSGEGKGWNQMWKYIPFEFLDGTTDSGMQSFTDFVSEILTNEDFRFTEQLEDELAANNFMDYQFVKKAVGDFKLTQKGEGVAWGNNISAEELEDLPMYMSISNGNGQHNYQVYKLYGSFENEDGSITPVYTAIKKLGYSERGGFRIYQFGWDFKYPANNFTEPQELPENTVKIDGKSPELSRSLIAGSVAAPVASNDYSEWMDIVPLKNVKSYAQQSDKLVDVMRHPDKNGMHFGNPFTPLLDEVKNGNASVYVADVKHAVEAFREWLAGTKYQDVEPERRQWILDKINSGFFTGKKMVYYTDVVPDASYGQHNYDAEHPSHPYIIKEFIDATNISNGGGFEKVESRSTISIAERGAGRLPVSESEKPYITEEVRIWWGGRYYTVQEFVEEINAIKDTPAHNFNEALDELIDQMGHPDDPLTLNDPEYSDFDVEFKYKDSRQLELFGEAEPAEQSLPGPEVEVATVESTISTVGYRKGDPQAHKDTAYVFTENAQANAAALGLDDSWVEDGYPKGDMVKTGVSDVNGTNQAGVRASTSSTYGSNNINSNAFGIVVKKYQQDESGRFIAGKGQFKDTDADFELFKATNLDMFKRLEESGLKKIMWPSQMGLGKAALPQRFAEWLQGELNRRFGIVSEVQKNNKAGYEGYGLQITSIQKADDSSKQSTAITPAKSAEEKTTGNQILEQFKQAIETLSGYFEGSAPITQDFPGLPNDIVDKLAGHFVDNKELSIDDYRQLWSYVEMIPNETGFDRDKYPHLVRARKQIAVAPTVAPQSSRSSQAIGTKESPIMIYSDGSDIKGTGAIGYGSVFEYDGQEYAMSGTEESDEIKKLKQLFPNAKFSNPTMEMLALATTLETIADAGIGEHIQINQDYKGAVNYSGLWNHSEGSNQRDAKAWNPREAYIKHLVERAERAIEKIEQNGGSVKIVWVKGHQTAGTEQARMNDRADFYAKNRSEINTLLDAYSTEQEDLYDNWTYEENSLNGGLFDNPNSTTYSDNC